MEWAFLSHFTDALAEMCLWWKCATLKSPNEKLVRKPDPYITQKCVSLCLIREQPFTGSGWGIGWGFRKIWLAKTL